MKSLKETIWRTSDEIFSSALFFWKKILNIDFTFERVAILK